MALGIPGWPVVLLLSLWLIMPMVSGSPTPTSAALVARESIMPDGSLDCETRSSSDYYGFGVRVGIYLSWFTAWVANVSMPNEIGSALDQNAIFLFALLLSMVRCAITGTLWRLDGLMLMHMSGGTIFGVMSLWGYRTCVYHVEGPRAIRRFGGFGTHMRLLLCVGCSTFGLYYWRYGIRDLNHDTGRCETVYTFMFAKVRVGGGVRVFYQIFSIACLMYFGSMLIVSSLAGVKRVTKMKWLMKEKYFRTTSRLRFATGFNQKELRYVFYFLRVANLCHLIFSMIMTEFTLNYNHVAGVLGENGHIFFPAQLIPLIIGVASFLRIVYFRYSAWRSPADIQPSLASEPVPSSSQSPHHHGLGVFKMFSPETNVGTEGSPHQIDNCMENDNDLDLLLVGQGRLLRYLVAWLPWLALYPSWRINQSDTFSPSSTLQGSPETSAHEKRQGHRWDSADINQDIPSPENLSGARMSSGRVSKARGVWNKQVNTLV